MIVDMGGNETVGVGILLSDTCCTACTVWRYQAIMNTLGGSIAGRDYSHIDIA